MRSTWKASMPKNRKPCVNFDCVRPTRTREHDFCSECWYKVSPMLKNQYYRAKYYNESQLPRAITNIIRFLGRDNAQQR